MHPRTRQSDKFRKQQATAAATRQRALIFNAWRKIACQALIMLTANEGTAGLPAMGRVPITPRYARNRPKDDETREITCNFWEAFRGQDLLK